MTRGLVLLVTTLLVGCATSLRTPTEVYFDSEGSPMSIAVMGDRIGILLRTSEAAGNVRAQIARKGLTVARIYKNDVLMVVSRAGLQKQEGQRLAREIRLESSQVVQAGLLVSTPQTETPAILTDELIIKFRSSGLEARRVIAANGMQLLMENPFVKGQYLVAVADGDDALAMANRFRQMSDVEYSYPNFYSVIYNLDTIPTDPLFGGQWHHRNTGASGGTATADARTTLAWDFTQGTAGTLISTRGHRHFRRRQ